MTPKETAYRENLALKNKLAAIKGNELLDIEAYTATWRFQRDLKDAYLTELKRSNEYLRTKAIPEAKATKERKEKNDAYKATPAGQALIARLNADRDRWIEHAEAVDAAELDSLNYIIADLLGEHWAVRHLTIGHIIFSVRSNEEGRDFVFGQDIEICYSEKGHWGEGMRFETNIGSTGTFNIQDTAVGDRARYYIDLGKFFAATEDVDLIKASLFQYDKDMKAANAAIADIDDRIANPLGI